MTYIYTPREGQKRRNSGNQARNLLNLPDEEVKIVPGDFGEWIVYVQSTSVNRNVIPKQRILVIN